MAPSTIDDMSPRSRPARRWAFGVVIAVVVLAILAFCTVKAFRGDGHSYDELRQALDTVPVPAGAEIEREEEDSFVRGWLFPDRRISVSRTYGGSSPLSLDDAMEALERDGVRYAMTSVGLSLDLGGDGINVSMRAHDGELILTAFADG
jgi:hypothetical protein